MNPNIYDIFISYRRKGGFGTAKHLNDLLVRDGYTVSFDIDTLREGKFDDTLLRRIEQCTDFILVVDKNAFDRTLSGEVPVEEDWLRRELAYALQLKRNVIPILLAGATFSPGLPDDIREVRNMNGPSYNIEYFDSFYSKLKNFIHSLPRNASANGAGAFRSGGSVVALPNLKVKADLDCIFYLDGEECMKLTAGALRKIPLAKGEYELKFVSVEHPADAKVIDFDMPNRETLLKVDLETLRQKRCQEEELQRKAAEAEALRQVEEARRKAEAEARRKAEEEKRQAELRGEFAVNGVSFKMILVEGGSFTMGATYEQGSDAFDDEKPAHRVILSTYSIGEMEVTQALWQAVMGSNPSNFKGGNRPVENVSWDDCQTFIHKLNSITGWSFRLPTEAEWEFAARGGNKSQGYKYSGSNNLGTVAWYDYNSGNETHPVKTKSPNELGIYDMSGNVWEWCQDWFGSYGSSTQRDPMGVSSGSYRVLRGGSWVSYVGDCRVSLRSNLAPDHRCRDLGLRLAL